jgi:hypothetical protein
MQTVTILRELWRLRLMVVLAGLLAAFVAISVAYKVSPSGLESRKYSVGLASARILVDTPDSQVVEVAPEGSDSTGVRANLLANLMVEGEIKTAIAERAGLRPDRLQGVSATTLDPSAAASPPDPRGYVLTTDVVSSQDGERLPIIEIEAQAPDAMKAARLAEAAISGLREHLDSKAAVEEVPDAKRLRLTGLGAPQARDMVRGPRLAMAIAAGMFVFLVCCAAILAFFALVRAWRIADVKEHPKGPLEYDTAVRLGIVEERATNEDSASQSDTKAAEPADGAGRNGFLRPAPPPPPPAPAPDAVDEKYRARTA